MSGNERRVIVIQERDRHLLKELSLLRVIDREQAKIVAGFHSTTRANSRLLALTKTGFLRRFFLGTSGGGQKGLYALSPEGARIVEVPYRGPRRRRDEVLIADLFVAHQLSINEIYCTLKYQPMPSGNIRFVRWMSFFEPLHQGFSLIPDGYAEILHPRSALTAFLEIDLGSEGRKVWKEKIKEYLRYALSGLFAGQFGQPRFRVLVILNSERRLQSIRAVVAAATEKIFWFATIESIRRGRGTTNGNHWCNSHEILLQLQSRHSGRASLLQFLREELRRKALSQATRQSAKGGCLLSVRHSRILHTTTKDALPNESPNLGNDVPSGCCPFVLLTAFCARGSQNRSIKRSGPNGNCSDGHSPRASLVDVASASSLAAQTGPTLLPLEAT
jgi:hypothetical protein